MAPGIAVIMVVGTGALLAAGWWAVEAVFPRYMVRRTAQQVATHRSALAALDIALPRANNDAAQAARLSAQRAWHAAQLEALSPTNG